tara:strand:+ start:335 stop:571 length:237 start_codon:yes stop_codon:yes gene_type:complete
MPFIEPTQREQRYADRCTKKLIEEQKKQRAERFMKRDAMREEAASCVKKEISQKTNSYKASSRTRVQPVRYGALGYYF